MNAICAGTQDMRFLVLASMWSRVATVSPNLGAVFLLTIWPKTRWASLSIDMKGRLYNCDWPLFRPKSLNVAPVFAVP